MIVEAEIAASVTFRERRKRKTSSDVILKIVSIEIPDLSDTDAPVVAWMPDVKTAGMSQAAWRRDAHSFIVPVAGDVMLPTARRANPKTGRKTVEDGVCAGNGIGAHFQQEPFIGMGLTSPYSRALRSLKRAVPSSIARSRFEVPEGAAIVSDDTDRLISLYQGLVAQEFAVVDGVLHRRTKHVPFAFEGYHGGIGGVRDIDILLRGSQPYEMQSVCFLAGRGKVGDQFGYRGTRKFLAADIVRPDLMPETEPEQLLRAWVEIFLDRACRRTSGFSRFHNGQVIGETNATGLLQFADLRDAFFGDATYAELKARFTAFVSGDLPGVAGTEYTYPGRRMLERLSALDATLDHAPEHGL